MKFLCPECRHRVTTRLASAGEEARCPSCTKSVQVPPLVSSDVVEAARWYCYDFESGAREAFRHLRSGPLGGPGWLEIRHDPQAVRPWWVVLYNLLSGTAADMERVYGIPPVRETHAWSAHERPDRLPCRMAHTEIIELTEVRASRSKLIEAAKRLGDAWYSSSPDITCREEAKARLSTSLFRRASRSGSESRSGSGSRSQSGER